MTGRLPGRRRPGPPGPGAAGLRDGGGGEGCMRMGGCGCGCGCSHKQAAAAGKCPRRPTRPYTPLKPLTRAVGGHAAPAARRRGSQRARHRRRHQQRSAVELHQQRVLSIQRVGGGLAEHHAGHLQEGRRGQVGFARRQVSGRARTRARDAGAAASKKLRARHLPCLPARLPPAHAAPGRECPALLQPWPGRRPTGARTPAATRCPQPTTAAWRAPPS